MRVRDARRSRLDPSRSGFRVVGRFTLEATEGVLIFDCRLVQAPDSRLLVYGPSSKADAQILSLSEIVRNNVVTKAAQALGFTHVANAA